jgi:hypothetical protein
MMFTDFAQERSILTFIQSHLIVMSYPKVSKSELFDFNLTE